MRLLTTKSGEWAILDCTECEEVVDEVVEMGDEPDWDSATITVCKSCLVAALGLIEDKP